MSTNIPQTKEQALAAKERFRFRITLLLIIIASMLLVAMLGWTGIIKPVAAADLSNGAFCMKVTNDSDPEITGMAGPKNCGTAELPPVVTPPAPKPDLAIRSCVVTNNGLGMLASVRLDWTSPQRYSAVSATVDGHAIPSGAIASAGPISGIYTYTMSVTKTQLDSLMAKTGGYSVTLRADATLEDAVSYGTRTLSVGAGGMASSCN